MSEDYILSKDRTEALINALIAALKPDGVYQVKITLTQEQINITPHFKTIEIKR